MKFTKPSIALAILLFATNGIATGHDVAREMTNSANLFLKSLDEAQTSAVSLEFDNELRKDWQFIPMETRRAWAQSNETESTPVGDGDWFSRRSVIAGFPQP